MSFNQHRTNPSQAVSNFKGRSDTPKAWPSTAVSTWINGGLFGGAESSWIMELVQGSSTMRQTYKKGSIAVNPFDGNVYVSGVSEPISGNLKFGPTLAKIDIDGNIIWSRQQTCVGSAGHYANPTGALQISFAPGSSDIYCSSTAEIAGTGMVWTRTDVNGNYLNGASDRVYLSGGCDRAGVGYQNAGSTLLVCQISKTQGPWNYTSFSSRQWTHNATNNSQATLSSYIEGSYNHFTNVSTGTGGVVTYSNNSAIERFWHSGIDYGYNVPTIINVTAGVQNFDTTMRYVNNAQAGNTGNLGARLGTKSTVAYGLAFGSYPGYIGRTAADVNSFLWSRVFSSGTATSSPEINTQIGPHIDSLGNIYSFGSMRYQVGGSNTEQGYIAKFDPNGNVLWQRGIKVEPLAITSGAQTNKVHSVTTNEAGTEVYIGLDCQAIQFVGTNSVAPRQALLKLHADGSNPDQFVKIESQSKPGSGPTNGVVYQLVPGDATISNGTLSITSRTTQGTSDSPKGTNSQAWGASSSDLNYVNLLEVV